MRRRFTSLLVILALASAVTIALSVGIGSASSPASSRSSARPTAAPHTNLIAARVKLVRVATGLDRPTALAFRAGDASRIYATEQGGDLVIVSKGHVTSTVLHLTKLSTSGEEGLLGFAFSKDGSRLYVDYTDPTGDIHVVEYHMKGNVANIATRRPILKIPHHTFPNHNGGDLVMGPDGYLYIGVGDGGGGGDTLHNGQNTDVLLGKILRINPLPKGTSPYSVPKSNPFVGKAGKRAEIWMYGLRNPWKFTFDRANGNMWIGDVGQDLYEEVDLAAKGQKGINWGWNRREGFHPYNGGTKPPGARDPLLERPHSQGDCAIIGGYVYRGNAIPNFNGAYVYGDECTGELRAAVQKNARVTQKADLNLNVAGLTTFGEGPSGTIYAASGGGDIFRLAAG